MKSIEPLDLLPCPDCGAQTSVDSLKCWLCGVTLPEPPAAGAVKPIHASSALAAPREFAPGDGKFTLNTLMLVVTLICVCMGAVATAPGLAIPLVVIVTPALVRTVVATSRRRAAGVELTTGDKIMQFVASFGLMFLIFTAAGFAFFISCTGACAVVMVSGNERLFGGNDALGVMFAIGAITGLVTFGVLTWMFWPKQRPN